MSQVGALNNQTAVITGAGRGIGSAIAQKLASLGASVLLCGRTLAEIDSTAAAIRQTGGKAAAVQCDVTDLRSVEAMAAHARQTLKSVNILVNNAGVGGAAGPLHEMPTDTWEKILNTNLRGVFYCIRSFAPLMISASGGHIINISSLAGKNPLPNAAAYAASKWGLNGLSYSVAEELRAHNIRVSVLAPGSVNTGFSPHQGKDPARLLQPEDIAHAVETLVTQAPQSFISEILLRPTSKP
ncbi:MAG: hypothetical protein QOD84_1308 [Acidobacteriaceae bacterium]|jgi:3-oxoacyl-[acyl-carrier protein] reductase